MVEYECPSCGNRLEASPFRMTCPECSGRLRHVCRSGT
ncbi:rubrerythrin-like domain-containing protein [Haloplanus sp. GCM10025708]